MDRPEILTVERVDMENNICHSEAHLELVRMISLGTVT